MQASQLHHDEEQAERPRAHRDAEVLPLRPAAHEPQRDPLSRSDEELELLAARARLGDRGAFEKLVVATSGQVYALALRLVGDEDDAADVVQETYLRAFRSIARFRGDAAVSTWLYRIVANCSSSYLSRRARSRSRQTHLDEGLGVAEPRTERDLEAVVGASVDRDALVTALRRLPASLRAPVVLRDVYDLPHEAIARELGISKTAAKVRLHRGRRRLRELIYPDARPAPGARRPSVSAPPAPGADQRGLNRRAQAL